MKVLFSSREGYFSLRRIRGIRAIRRRAGLITSERYIGELGVRYLSTLHRGQDSKAKSYPWRSAVEGLAVYAPSSA